jgi:nicotinate-nucleotide adenylyltransferase
LARFMPRFLPRFETGLRIGLFGGSFNPPHEGHLLVAQTALRRLQLDRIWWLVTPGNPLKDVRELPLQSDRMAACRRLIGHDPRIVVSGLEASIGTRYTEQTIRYLRQRCPGVHFVWLMGADNLAGFHRWQKWPDIARSVPIAIIDRPGVTLRAVASPAARHLAPFRIGENEARRLAGKKAPAWLFLHGRRSDESSTRLRAAQRRAFE